MILSYMTMFHDLATLCKKNMSNYELVKCSIILVATSCYYLDI